MSDHDDELSALRGHALDQMKILAGIRAMADAALTPGDVIPDEDDDGPLD